MKQTFSPSEAALSIFELAKRQPQFVLRFCIIYALFAMVAAALAGAFGVGEALQNVNALNQPGKAPNIERMTAAILPATNGIILVSVFSLLTAVLTTALGLRKAVRDEEAGPFGLQLGKDELRIFLGFLLMILALFLVNIAASLIGNVLIMGNANLLVLPIVGQCIAMFAIGVRLSQFGVMSIADEPVGVLASWQITKGHAWRFAGAIILWVIIGSIMGTIVQALGSFGASIMGTQVGAGLPVTLAEFLTPGFLFYALLNGLVAGFSNLGSLCVGAYAWHQMRGDLPVNATAP